MEAVIEKVLGTTANRSNPRQTRMVLDLIMSSLEADAAASPAFAELVSFGKLDSVLGGDSRALLASALRRSLQDTERVRLLTGILARVDMTEESAAKEFVS